MNIVRSFEVFLTSVDNGTNENENDSPRFDSRKQFSKEQKKVRSETPVIFQETMNY